MVEQLDGNNYQFKIFCSNKDLDGGILNVEFDKWIDFSPNTQVWYVSKRNLLSVLEGQIREQQPDYLYMIGIYSWFFNFKPLFFTKKIKKIISVRGMLHPGALSQKSFKKKVYLQVWKILGLHKKHVFHATDEEEKKCIIEIFGPKAKVVVAANFPRLLPKQAVCQKKPGELKLISIGLLSPMKNILMVLEALQRDPSPRSIEYNIYGPVKEESYWQECLIIIDKMPSNIKITYHGNIGPEKIEEALSQNHVFILPSKSENYGHAIIEALSAGLPVITSNNTPWVNLRENQAGVNVSLASHTDLQNAIAEFVAMSFEELVVFSEKAREYALRSVDVEATRKQYEIMFGR